MGTHTESCMSAIEEEFPRIAKTLCEHWGKATYLPYLSSLVFDERGSRQGFPVDVCVEHFMLYDLLDYRPAGDDVWTEADQR